MRWFFFIFVFFSSFGCSHRQSRPVNSGAGRTFLYSLTKNEQTWYVFGTHHYIGIEELPSSVLNKFNTSTTLVVESTGIGEKKNESRNFKDRKPMPAQPSARSRKALLARGISTEIISKASLGALCKLYFWGPNRPDSMDSAFEASAQTLQKKIIALDEPVQIRKVTERDLNGCDLETMTLNSPEEIEKYTQSLKNEYRSGHQKFYENEEIYTDVKERNIFWFESLKKINEKNVFIAVGVSHLYGPTGLLKLFEENQFQIQRLSD